MGNKFQIVLRLLIVVFLAVLPVSPVFASDSTQVTVRMQFATGLSNFTSTYISDTEMDLAWAYDATTIGNIMIRSSYNTYPGAPIDAVTAPTDGNLVYYGTASSFADTSVNFDQNAGPIYYTAYAQKLDSTWVLTIQTNQQESMEMLFLTLVILALALTVATFVWQLLPLALGGMLGWWGLAAYILLGGNPAISVTTTWGLVLSILFVLLAFIPLIRYISRLGKVAVSHSDKTGRMYSLWEKKPEPQYISSAKRTQMRRREELRAAIDRASHARRSR